MAVLPTVGNPAGYQPAPGKTRVAAALLAIANAAGKQAAYIKPFSDEPDADPDVAFISSLLQSNSGGPAVPAPKSMADLNDNDQRW